MLKKNIIITILALITSACASTAGPDPYQQSVELAADKISPSNQKAYFACKFERRATECLQKIWATHPKPELSRKLTRETLPDFLSAVELRGAGLIVSEEGKHTCGKPKDVSGLFWNRGYDVTCADGQHFIVSREDNQWRVTKAPSKE